MLKILIALNKRTKKPSLIPIKNNGISAIASIRAGTVKIYFILPFTPLNLSIWSTAINLQIYSIKNTIPKKVLLSQRVDYIAHKSIFLTQ